MFKNVANQKIAFYAHDVAANGAKTGDGANLTAYVSKDGAPPAPLADTSATELDASSAKGMYVFDVTAAESNGDILVFSAASTTANVQIDPLIVFTVPANFSALAIDANGRIDVGRWLGGVVNSLVGGRVDVSVGAMTTAAVQAIWDALTSALTAVGSIGKLLVDKLAGVSGQVASQAEVTAIQNNTRTVITVPEVLERPDSGTVTYRVELFLYDEVGNMEVPDSAPTVALVNQNGTDLSARLDATMMALVSTGRYRVIYTANAGDALEQLNWTFSVVEGGATRVFGRQSLIVDTTAADFTAADRTTLQAIAANADVPVSTRLPTAGYTAPDNAGIAAIKNKTDGLPASPAAVGSPMTLPMGERDAVADALLDRADGIETGETPRQTLRLLRAANVGQSDGFPDGPVHFRDKANTKDRITANTDQDGNRTAVTTDAT